jgi:hypothetical protein
MCQLAYHRKKVAPVCVGLCDKIANVAKMSRPRTRGVLCPALEVLLLLDVAPVCVGVLFD